MKKEITWNELIKRITTEQQAKGTFRGLKEVFGVAKKEWDTIKSGKHGLFSVGKSKKTKGKGQNNNKTVKNKMKKIKLCDVCKLCDKCMKTNRLSLSSS
jgi:hypothetical protein